MLLASGGYNYTVHPVPICFFLPLGLTDSRTDRDGNSSYGVRLLNRGRLYQGSVILSPISKASNFGIEKKIIKKPCALTIVSYSCLLFRSCPGSTNTHITVRGTARVRAEKARMVCRLPAPRSPTTRHTAAVQSLSPPLRSIRHRIQQEPVEGLAASCQQPLLSSTH